MRVVGVSRVLDEADVIEPFIRHHAALLDRHIVLDNGSSDSTLEILRHLHGEGVALEVYQTQSPVFLEQSYNTGLYRLAVEAGADWVVFLDADELLTVRDAARPHDVLSLIPDGLDCVRLFAYRYECPALPAGEHPFTALRRRAATPDMPKIAIRRLDPARVSVYAGNHLAFIDGVEDVGLQQERLFIAHTPDRHPLQIARKTLLARLKPIASGEAVAAHVATHRSAAFDAMKTAPRAWLEKVVQREEPGLIDEPVPYLGGELHYTDEPDELARLLSLLAVQTEQLARSHGAILDAKRLIKHDLLRRGAEIRRLF